MVWYGMVWYGMVVYQKDGKTCEGSPLSALQAYNQIISLLSPYYFPLSSLFMPYDFPIIFFFYLIIVPYASQETWKKHEETTF